MPFAPGYPCLPLGSLKLNWNFLAVFGPVAVTVTDALSEGPRSYIVASGVSNPALKSGTIVVGYLVNCYGL